MKVAIIGASGKTGFQLVRASLERGYAVAGVCRDASAEKLAEFHGREGFELVTAPAVPDREMLTRALAGCDAVVALLISVRQLKATALVTALAEAGAVHGVTRMVFTAGEVTAVAEPGEVYTLRQRLMLALLPSITQITPFSMADMLKASALVREQPGLEWTIVRAPTLRDTPAAGYRLCDVSEVRSSDVLSREDYAACLLDCIENPDYHRRTLTVAPVSGKPV